MAIKTANTPGRTVEWYDILPEERHREGRAGLAPVYARPCNDGSGGLWEDRLTHITMRAYELTPRD
jgi:hypothetical protein